MSRQAASFIVSAKNSVVYPRVNFRYWNGPASLPVHVSDIMDHIEDVPTRRPAPTNYFGNYINDEDREEFL
jgi:hypothetical protein